MANYYHEARAHVRRLKEMSEDNKRRAERRAELASAQAEHPINFLMGEGHSCKIHRSTEQYNAIERQEGMIAWNDHTDNMIDRFDGRALLDFYREPSTSRRQEKAPEEVELDEWVAFESYRDLVRLLSRGISESEGLAFVEHENIEIRAKAKVAAAAAVSGTQGGEQAALATASNISSGLAGYAVFGYDLDDASSTDNDSEEQPDGEGGYEEDSPEEGEGRGAQVLDRDELDRVGEEQFGIEHFSSRLKRVLKFEGDADAFRFKAASRRRISRKKYAERAKRMAGQGLDPHGHPSDWKDLPNQPLREGRSGASHRRGSNRASPDYHSHSRHRRYSSSRSRSSSGGGSRSRSPRAHGQRGRTEYITEFHGESAHHNRHSGWVDESAAETRHPATRGEGVIYEAMPGRREGPGVGASMAYQLDIITDLRALDPSRIAQEKEKERRKDVEEKGKRGWERGAGHFGKPAVHTQTKRDSKAKSKPGEAKESAQDRLKRIMAAQLNKQVQKDNLVTTQKKIQAERDRQARLQIERVAFAQGQHDSPRSGSPSPSPAPHHRYRSRSPPPRPRGRSRTWSRLRSWSRSSRSKSPARYRARARSFSRSRSRSRSRSWERYRRH